MVFPSDLAIAQEAQLEPLERIGAQIGITPDLLEHHGEHVAKVKLEALERLADRPLAKYVVVSAVTPTPLGEGKTTVTVGLGQAFQHLGRTATVAIRQPSMGPTLGIKGGAAGGGYSQVVPMELFNMHLTGDFHAVTEAHNLLAAIVDNHLFQGNALGLDIHPLAWRRVLDVNDRALRNVVIGLGGAEDGVPRQSGFDITAASEVMAVLSLATSVADLRARLARIVVGYTKGREPVTAEQLHAAGAMAAILAEAVKPNLLQTLEHTPVLVHMGPFGNIGTGNSSVLAAENPEDVLAGSSNLRKQIENVRIHGVTPVVAVNVFPSDHPSEWQAIEEVARQAGARVARCRPASEGGKGVVELAEAVAEAAEEPGEFRFAYAEDATLREKIETIATRVYEAAGVDYSPLAARQLEDYERDGFGRLAVCIAKTHLSLSSDPSLKGAPTGWRMPVREVRASAGAGYVYPICGEMQTMPGLGRHHAAFDVDLLDDGTIVGLS